MIYIAAAVVGFLFSWAVDFRDAPVLWGALVFASVAIALDSIRKLKLADSQIKALRHQFAGEIEELRQRLGSQPVAAPQPLAPTAVPAPAPTPATIQEPVAPKEKTFVYNPPPVVPPPSNRTIVAPAGPSVVDEWTGAIVKYFQTGNTIAKIGMVILFIGVGFLVKYTSDRGLLPIEFRLSALALGAMALSAIGWNLREKRKKFGAILQGGGLGILYVTIFAAFKFYSLIGAGFALPLLVATTVLLVTLSLLQNEIWLAILATAGAFLAPILASTGEGSHVALFSYFLMVNLSVLAISYYRSWRWLNVQGFVFTFLLTGIWAVAKFEPSQFASTEPFLIAFFAIYFMVGVLFARVTNDKSGLALDGTIVFGTPIAAFALQAKLVHGMQYGLAYSAAGLAAVYIGGARFLRNKSPELYRFLVESFLALGVCFATLAIPFAVTGRWTASAWSLEAAALIWVGLRQSRRLPFWGGAILSIVSVVTFLGSLDDPSGRAFLNAQYIGAALLACGLLTSSFVVAKLGAETIERVDRRVYVYLFGGMGLLAWFTSLTTEAHRVQSGLAISLVFLSAAAFVELGRKLKWIEMAQLRFVMAPVLGIWLLEDWFEGVPRWEWVTGGIVATSAVILRAKRDDDLVDSKVGKIVQLAPMQIGLAIFVSCVLSKFAAQEISFYSFWRWMPLFIVPTALASMILSRTPRWPNDLRYSELKASALPLFLIFGLVISFFFNLCDSGATTNLKYYPIFSALDLSQIFVFAVTARALFKAKRSGEFNVTSFNYSFALYGVLVLIWLSAMVVRTVHHQTGVPWSFGSNFDNLVVQMSLSLLWSMSALALMFVSSKKAWRGPWIAGVAVLGLVILKLVTVDLASKGTVERIVSFIGTGLILLLIGYLAPLPPSKEPKNG